MTSLQTLMQIWRVYKAPINWQGYIDPSIGQSTAQTVMDTEGWTGPTRLDVKKVVQIAWNSLRFFISIILAIVAGRWLTPLPAWMFWVGLSIATVIILYKHARFLITVYNGIIAVNLSVRNNLEQAGVYPTTQPGTTLTTEGPVATSQGWTAEEDQSIVDSVIDWSMKQK
jgi:hypothetical protein